MKKIFTYVRKTDEKYLCWNEELFKNIERFDQNCTKQGFNLVKITMTFGLIGLVILYFLDTIGKMYLTAVILTLILFLVTVLLKITRMDHK